VTYPISCIAQPSIAFPVTFLVFASFSACLGINVIVFPLSLLVTSLLQGEAFVPESIVRFGARVAGRDGVQTSKAEDNRIK
jgi:hypothetical protein